MAAFVGGMEFPRHPSVPHRKFKEHSHVRNSGICGQEAGRAGHP